MISRALLALLLTFFFAAGCGQKGPLYIAGDPTEIKTNVSQPDEGQTENDDDEDEDEQSQDNR